MASIPSNGYAEVMAGTNNYSGSNSFDGSCPQTAIPPAVNNDLCNKLYVDTAGGGSIINLLTEKGSLVAGDGTAAAIFAQNPYETALVTTTVYDWNSLAVAQSRAFTTTVATQLIIGTSIKITYNGTDEITGTITAIVGTTVTITITALTSAVYTAVPQITTTIPVTISGSITNGDWIQFFPATTTPTNAVTPANTIITNGVCYIYDALPPSPTFALNLTGTGNIQRAVSNSQPPPAYPGSPTPSSVTWQGTNGGCFVRDSQALVILLVTDPPGRVNFGFPFGAPLTPAYFAGVIEGYQVPYSTGVISIVGSVALLADPVAPQGLKWGVVAGGGSGAVNSVTGGVNITVSGAVSTPQVNLSAPLTSILDVGSQTIGSSTGTMTITPLAANDCDVVVSGAGKLHVQQSTAGGQANPLCRLSNSNATGSVAMEIYKNKPTAGVNGDVLFNQSVYGKDSGNAKQEFTRITHTIRDSIGATEDGSIELSAFRAGAINTFLQINGVDNEVNCLKNLDMGGNNIVTNTGDLTISTAGSAGLGNITLTSKSIASMTGNAAFMSATLGGSQATVQVSNSGLIDLAATQQINFTGANLQASGSSGSSGQFLVINLNGTYFKIPLDNN